MRKRGERFINANDIVGKRIGMLEVINYAGARYEMTRGGERVSHLYTVKCECGIIKSMRRSALLNNATRSCGCVKRRRRKYGN